MISFGKPVATFPDHAPGIAMPPSRLRALLVIASLLGCGVAAAAEDQPPEQPSAAQMMDDLMYGRGTVGGPFTLTDQTGRKRSDSEFRGKLMVVYFGYTFCPDVCPADLMAITQALDALGPRRKASSPFSSRSIRSGTPRCSRITSPRSIAALSASPALRRKFERSPIPTRRFMRKARLSASGEYSIDHAGVIYLMGRHGEYLGFMPPQTSPDRLTEVLRKYLAR